MVAELCGDGAKQIAATFWTLRQLLAPEYARDTEADARTGQPELLRCFLGASGRVTAWPVKRQSQDLVLSYLIAKFAHGREYAEREINQLLNRTPDGARYWRTAIAAS